MSLRQKSVLWSQNTLNRVFLTNMWISVCASGIKDDFLCRIVFAFTCLFVKIFIVYKVFQLFHMKQENIVSRETIYFKNTKNRGNR